MYPLRATSKEWPFVQNSLLESRTNGIGHSRTGQRNMEAYLLLYMLREGGRRKLRVPIAVHVRLFRTRRVPTDSESRFVDKKAARAVSPLLVVTCNAFQSAANASRGMLCMLSSVIEPLDCLPTDTMISPTPSPLPLQNPPHKLLT